MKVLTFAISLVFCAVIPLAAAPRLALVRVRDIYTALPSTIALQQQVKSDREAIMKSERAEELRKIIAELQLIQSQLGEKPDEIEQPDRQTLARSYELKRQEAQTLQQDFEAYKMEQEKSINTGMVLTMRATLDRISAKTQAVAKEKGYDLVLDSSGNSNTGVPFVLQSEGATDLTVDVQAALQNGESAISAQRPAAKATAPP